MEYLCSFQNTVDQYFRDFFYPLSCMEYYLSKQQKDMIKKIEASGGSVKVVYSVADVILWLNEEVKYETNKNN